MATIPDFETVMRPLLVHLADGHERSTAETLDALASVFGLSDEDRQQLLPSGKQSLFTNRVAWAKFYLKKALLVETTRRGVYRITQRGKQVLGTDASPLSVQRLQQFSEFRDFLLNSRKGDDVVPADDSAPLGQATSNSTSKGAGTSSTALTPEESLESLHSRITAQLASDLLDRVKSSSPEFFERLVVKLLLALGYGGSRQDAGRAVGKSGDGGIDGVINEDRLGLDTIYVQAKRWETVVGRPEIQKFAGALQGQRARKGVFITTSSFTADARAFPAAIDNKIVLIDGDQLTRLMIEHNVGVTPVVSYELKRIDSDYFTDE